jgi:hypothetical protein
MADNRAFEDDDIFSDEDISQSPLSKGPRFIPTWIANEFRAWFARTYPDIPTMRNISRNQMEQFINEFQYDTGISYNASIEDWYTLIM